MIAKVESNVSQAQVASKPSRRWVNRHVVGMVTLPALLVIACVFFGTWSTTASTFASTANVHAILSSNAVVAVSALALLCPMIAGQFDLSVGANIGITSFAVVGAFSHGASIAVALLVGVISGMAVGAVNGVFVAGFGVNSFIVTLGMTSVISGAVLAYSNGQSILAGVPTSLTSLSSTDLLGLPQIAWVVIGLAVVMFYFFQYTSFGRAVRAVGSNVSAARLVGLNVRLVTLLSFVISGALAGCGGILLVVSSGGASPQAGPNYLLPAFTAVFLGATVSKLNVFNVGGTVLAVLFVAVCVSGLVLAGSQPWIQQVFQGGILVAAVTLSTLARRAQRDAPV